MKPFVLFVVLGLAAGSVYAGLGIGLVLTYRASGIINFAHGATAMYTAYVYAELRKSGELVFPVVGIPGSVDLGGGLGTPAALTVALAVAAALGVALNVIVFRPLHTAPALARVVAAIGVMITLQAVVSLRFGTTALPVDSFLPSGTMSILGATVPVDRLWIAAVLVLLTAILATVLRFTGFGLATRALSDDEAGLSLLGYSTARLAALNWAISAVVGGCFGILLAPITTLNPLTYTYLVVPALAAALLGRFRSLWWTLAGGLGLGVVQSQVTRLQLPWAWLSPQALKQVLPFAMIAAVLFFLDRALPPRGGPAEALLPLAREPWRLLKPGIAVAVATTVLVGVTSGEYRGALVVSMIAAILCLSLVIVTGFLGQVSLAQMAFAGAAGFTLSHLASGLGVPFPLAPLAAALMAGACGVLVAIPASRVRGASLTIITLGAAIAVEELVFRNLSNGLLSINPVPPPSFLGVDLGPIAGDGSPRASFAMFVLGVLSAVAIGVVTLRRSALGRRMLAVRANERAAAGTGVNVFSTKLIGFGLSAFVAGIGGVMLGYQQGALSDQSFSIGMSLALLAACYVGGISTVSGALVGGLLFSGGLVATVVERALHLGRYQTLVSGIVLVATALLNPQGIAGAAPSLSRLVRRRRRRGPIELIRADATTSA